MPIDVNTQERLRAIAIATLEVAEARGADGVTMRAVAERMGGSTTLVTNYIPNRAGLLMNAVGYAFEQWQDESGASSQILRSRRSARSCCHVVVFDKRKPQVDPPPAH